MMMNMDDYSNSDLLGEYEHLTQMATSATMILPDWNDYNHGDLEYETDQFCRAVEDAVQDLVNVLRDRKREVLHELSARGVIE